MSRSRTGTGWSTRAPSTPFSFRQPADLLYEVSVHPGVNESNKSTVRHHSQGGVAGVDQGSGRLDDVPENVLQVVRPSHGQVGAQQATQTALRRLHLTGAG